MEVAVVLDDLISNVVNNEQKVILFEASDEEIIEEIDEKNDLANIQKNIIGKV